MIRDWLVRLGAVPVLGSGPGTEPGTEPHPGPGSDGRVEAEVRVWAPSARRVRLWLEAERSELDLSSEPEGYWSARCPLAPGDRYAVAVDDGPWRPDPAARALPEGVHGPAAFVPPPPAGPATRRWTGRALEDLVLYELHVGTFTPEGTFDAAIAKLDGLVELGVTAVEMMPLAEVGGAPRARNWGYDGVQPFCVRHDYGGAEGLARFVEAAHARGLAVVEDVVYNHLGPEGSYLHDYGPVFSELYRTPWGPGLNFDGAGADGLRRYFLEHVRVCFEERHLDGLRLDSVVSILDRAAVPFLEEVAALTDELSVRLGRPLHLFAEADDNDPRWVRPRAEGGLGLGAMWADDLHHAIHAHLTGERAGYYADFGRVDAVARAFVEGAALTGQHARYRGRRWGRRLDALPPHRLVVYAQNHDQVGNRADGARLTTLLPVEAARAALALPLLAPALPLLFMGQEYGEEAPFHFFCGFEEAALDRRVEAGRRAELAAFGWTSDPPPPGAPRTCADSTLQWAENPDARAWRRLHRDAIALGLELRRQGRPTLEASSEAPPGFAARYPDGALLVAHLGAPRLQVDLQDMKLRFDSGLDREDPGGPRIEVWVPGDGWRMVPARP